MLFRSKGITEPEDRKINFQDYKDTDEEELNKYIGVNGIHIN